MIFGPFLSILEFLPPAGLTISPVALLEDDEGLDRRI